MPSTSEGWDGSGTGPSTRPPLRSAMSVRRTAAWSTTRWSSERRNTLMRAGPVGTGGLLPDFGRPLRRGIRLDRGGYVVEELGDIERLGQDAGDPVVGCEAAGVGRDDHD